MKEFGPSPPPEDDEKEEAEVAQPEGLEYWANLFREEQEREEDEEEEEDDEEDSSVTTKKQAPLRKLFGQTVSKEEEDEEEPEDEARPAFNLPLVEPEENVPDEEPVTFEASDDVEADEASREDTSLDPVAYEGMHLPEPLGFSGEEQAEELEDEEEDAGTQTTVPQTTPTVPPTAQPHFANQGGNALPPTPPTPNVPPPPVPPAGGGGNRGGGGPAGPGGPGGPNVPPPPGANPNIAPGAGPGGNPNVINPAADNINVTNIENRPAWGPAIVSSLVVDQMSRHRDRRLRREGEELKKQLEQDREKNEEQQQQAERMRQQMQEQVDRNAEHLQQQRSPEAEAAPSQEETKPEKTEPQKPYSEHSTEHKAQPVLERAPEVAVTTTKEVLQPELKDKQAELLLNQVEQAAEQNVALEGLYEHRHEAKDVPTSRQQYDFGQGGSPSSVPSTTAQPPASAYDTDISADHSVKSIDSAYRSAALSGLFAGLAIVIMALLFLLLL